MKKQLHLDADFLPYGNENSIDYEAFLFNGGEPHIKLKTDLSDTECVQITQRVNSFNDMGLLLLAIDAVQRCGVPKIEILIPYFPAARQDRVMVAGEPLSVKVYADLLNAQKLHKVTVYDAHSEVTPAVLNGCEAIDNHKFIQKVVAQLGSSNLKLISPDGGALKKIYKVSAHLGGMPVVECSKSRDVKTGKLSGFKVYAEDLGGADCLIVDDICDAGGTFMGLAKALKERGAGKLYLAVSHGIFSKGLDSLSQYFDTIFTTDSFRTIEREPRLVQIKLAAGLLS